MSDFVCKSWWKKKETKNRKGCLSDYLFMLSKHDPFHNGTGGLGRTEYASVADPVGVLCDVQAERHLVSSVENSSVTQCSPQQVHYLTMSHVSWVLSPITDEECIDLGL